MAAKDDLQDWVLQALGELGGSGSIVDVCKHIWEVHERELRNSGDLFYTWQYDVRWAAQRLRDDGRLQPAHGRRSGPWKLTRSAA